MVVNHIASVDFQIIYLLLKKLQGYEAPVRHSHTNHPKTILRPGLMKFLQFISYFAKTVSILLKVIINASKIFTVVVLHENKTQLDDVYVGYTQEISIHVCVFCI